MSGIFISYRRDDSSGHAGRVYDGLAASFGADRVDIDIDAVEPGDDFVERITMAVVSSAACLVVIGPRWLRAEDEDGRWRLGEADDFVRVEIETALQNGVPIIPTLVNRARMPRSEDLPESIRPLSRRQAVELSDIRWREDMDRLVRALSRRLEPSDQQREAEEPPATPANLKLVRSLYGAWGCGERSAIEWAHPEIEFVIADGPAPGRWTGRAGMAEGFRDLLGGWEEWCPQADEYRELDGERVLVLDHFSGARQGERTGGQAGSPGS